VNTLFVRLYRDLSCAAASVAITLILAGAFVQSTAVPPGMGAHGAVFVALQPEHAWFGQPEPAVLVD
jgi:hypothetical protein